jgi:hypothetical protein
LLSIYSLMDTFDMALVSHVVYFYSVTNYGQPGSLVKPVWYVPIRSIRLIANSLTIPVGPLLYVVSKLSIPYLANTKIVASPDDGAHIRSFQMA